MASFNGLGLHIGNLSRLSDAETRSACPENPTGEKGKGAMAIPDPKTSPARSLGQGWKVSPYIIIQPGETAVLADIAGQGAIQQIWMTPTGLWRNSILRFYWDDQAVPCRMPGRRFLCMRMEQVRASLIARGMRESGQRVQLLLGNAVSKARSRHADQHG